MARKQQNHRGRAVATVVVAILSLTTVWVVGRRAARKAPERLDVTPEDWFPFAPDADPFAAAPLDLRWMNEARAGDGGFIKVRGDSFVHEKTGQSVRFWAVDVASSVLEYDQAGLQRLARFLAKFGVNMVRFHGPLWKDDGFTKIDQTKLDRVHALTAALKNEGIYLELSTYFPLWMRPTDGPGFEGYDGKQHPFGLPFFSQTFQRMQKDWWRAMLTAPNPYTGLPLASDPTLAFIEIINEDSLLFFTFVPYGTVPAPQMGGLEKLFGDWLQKRRGPLAQTFSRWGGAPIRGDDATAGRAGVMPPSEIIRNSGGRARDTASFLGELQRGYFDEMCRYLKEDLSFKGSVAGSNWITADARTLGPLDKWSNLGCDFMDRHGYFGGPHEGERAAYSISNGDRYNDATALRFETGRSSAPSFELPLMDVAYDGKPSMISEINWPPPNRYRTEMPVLAAAYGALQGSDAFVFFVGGENTWARQLDKFTISDPVAMGQFPAAALIYRQGLVKTGDVVVQVEADLPGLQDLKGLPITAPQNLDALRAEDIVSKVPGAATASRTPAQASIDPLAFLVGRVEVNVGRTGAGGPRTAELSTFIDRRGQTVRSATGELLWDWGRGLATIDAPAAQGATGLLQQAGTITLRDISVTSGNEYGSVLLVALDGEPLARSRRMLLQVMSEDTNTGWSAPGRGLRTISAVGGPPLVVRKLAGRVTLRRSDAPLLEVRPLDFNGYETHVRVEVAATGEITLLPRTFYYVIEKSMGPG